MPNYHCSVKVISRADGRSATAAAAYRSAERIRDEREDRVHDYEPRGGVQFSEIMRPEQSPERWDDRSTLWNEVERDERRCDAQLAREVEVSLPRELNRGEQIELVREYARENFVERGMVADINIHDRSDGNPHAHIMLTTRSCDREGFGNKDRSWNDRENVKQWRQNWERDQNRALERKYEKERTPEREREYVDCRSYKDREDERTPQRHMGPERTQIERQEQSRCEREGREYSPVTERGQENEYIREINRLIERARVIAREIAERARERARSLSERVKELAPTRELAERTTEQARAAVEKNQEMAQEKARQQELHEHQRSVVHEAREQGFEIDKHIPLSEAYTQAKEALEQQREDREYGRDWE